MKSKIIVWNKLMAEVLGVQSRKIHDGCSYYFSAKVNPIGWMEGDMEYHENGLLFHKSWDWLMPVWKKIKSDMVDNDVLYMSTQSAILDVNIKKAHRHIAEFLAHEKTIVADGKRLRIKLPDEVHYPPQNK